jgi:hypothetical protein
MAPRLVQADSGHVDGSLDASTKRWRDVYGKTHGLIYSTQGTIYCPACNAKGHYAVLRADRDRQWRCTAGHVFQAVALN